MWVPATCPSFSSTTAGAVGIKRNLRFPGIRADNRPPRSLEVKTNPTRSQLIVLSYPGGYKVVRRTRDPPNRHQLLGSRASSPFMLFSSAPGNRCRCPCSASIRRAPTPCLLIGANIASAIVAEAMFVLVPAQRPTRQPLLRCCAVANQWATVAGNRAT
jgi:hypothetical protein